MSRPSQPASLRRPSMYGAHRSSEDRQRPYVPDQSRSRQPEASTSRSAPSRQPTPLSASGTPDGRDRRKSKVDAALLKKRQSISHHTAADVAAFGVGQRAPPVPSTSKLADGEVPRIGAGGIDLTDLNKDKFDADQCAFRAFDSDRDNAYFSHRPAAEPPAWLAVGSSTAQGQSARLARPHRYRSAEERSQVRLSFKKSKPS